MFWPKAERPVLREISLSVRAGEFVAILGANGSGKTTLLRCIVRLLKPASGTILIAGREMAELTGSELQRARRSVGLISQSANLVKRRSVLANVATGSLGRRREWWTSAGVVPQSELELAHRYLETVGLDQLESQRAGTLSGGQAQRVAVARALAQQPRLLLADEPVASLDPEAAGDVLDLLRRLAHDDGLSVLCVLHQPDLALAYADRIVGLQDAHVAFDVGVERGLAGNGRCSLPIRNHGVNSDVRLRRRFFALAGAAAFLALVVQAAIVTGARPQELVTGVHGMADLLRRSFPPNVAMWSQAFRPTLETLDTAFLGTVAGVVFAIPFAVLAARNTTPSPALYVFARASIALFRAVPDLVWALLFVTAVGLGAFPGVLALSVHSIGMLGRLFAEVIEDIDMGPVEAVSLTGANRFAVFTHAVVPGVAPSLLGIALYRLDENIRASIVLGFVGAGGIGFQLLSAMNLFQYRDVSFYLIVNFVLVVAVERASAALRKRVS